MRGASASGCRSSTDGSMADKPARLIAVDGVDGRALARLARAARAIANGGRRRRGGISRWDASGLFEELMAANDEAGVPSTRTLLLVYAADLVFRLRWQIRPALAEGKSVVAAPYVDSAVAFGRAAGIPAGWLTNLFRFAPKPDAIEHAFRVSTRVSKRPAEPVGFVELGCGLASATAPGFTQSQLLDRAREHLRVASRRATGVAPGPRRARAGSVRRS